MPFIRFYYISVRGKAPKVRKNTDGGAFRLRLSEAKNPRFRNINKTKAPKGRQNVQLVCKQHIKNSVAPSGLLLLSQSYRGLAPPSVVCRLFETLGKPP